MELNNCTAILEPTLSTCNGTVEETNNVTTDQADLKNAGFIVFSTFLLCILLFTIIANWILAVALVRAKQVPLALRIFLVNLLMAGFVLSCASVLILTTALALAANVALPAPHHAYCHVLLWLYGVGAVARLWGLTMYSLAVFVTVKYGKTKIKMCHIVVALFAIWIFSAFINLHTLMAVDVVYVVQYSGGVACFPDYAAIPSAQRYGLATTWALLGGILPFALSVAMPIVTLCYIRYHKMSEDASYKKAIAKFGLFLVTGNFINIIGQIGQGVVAIAAFYISRDSFANVYVAYGFVVLSLIPTPILIVVFLKPVREQLQNFCLKSYSFLCKPYRGKHSVSMRHRLSRKGPNSGSSSAILNEKLARQNESQSSVNGSCYTEQTVCNL
jgi:hypothetical protein